MLHLHILSLSTSPKISCLVKFVDNSPTSIFTTQSLLLTHLEKKAFENIVGKGENAGNQHFLLSPQCFLIFPSKTLIFESRLFGHLQML